MSIEQDYQEMAHRNRQRRLVRCVRLAMSAYARRWRVIRCDSLEAVEARHCLAEAIRLREQAKAWETTNGHQ